MRNTATTVADQNISSATAHLIKTAEGIEIVKWQGGDGIDQREPRPL